MENKNPNISNEQLKNELINSYIDDAQKQELSVVVEDMTDEERQQLLDLIRQSQLAYEASQNVSEGNDEAIQQLNLEYQQKIKALMKKSVSEAYEESEKLEGEGIQTELKEVEGEINQININQPSEKEAGDDELTQQTRAHLAKKSHPVLRFIFILLILGLVAAGIYYGTQVLLK